ncbi:Ankyrin repeat domain-containing protein 13C-B, partial [Ananas comosus]
MGEEMRTEEGVRISEYAHSPAHYAVAVGDAARLRRVLAALPRLSHPSEIATAADAAREERRAARVAAALDRRDVPGRDTPLHLAARLPRAPALAAALAAAGADPSLQNAAGWTPLQEALCRRRRNVAALLVRHHRVSAWAKLRRRLPALVAALRNVPDFALHLSFHFESPLLPFLPRAAPSDTYRLWKRGADLRADTSLAGFDGLRARRADHSFLFLGSGANPDLPAGSLLVLHRGRKEVRDAFDGLGLDLDLDRGGGDDDPFDDDDDASACRPGLDITGAELVPRTNWRRREKTETVGEWKAKVYDVHNVVFSFKTMRAAADDADAAPAPAPRGDVVPIPLEIRDDDEDDGFLVAEIPARHSCYEPSRARRDEEGFTFPAEEPRRRSVHVPQAPRVPKRGEGAGGGGGGGRCKEKEMVKSLRPTVWLTEDFPLKVEEIMPLLDILSSKVKAVRRLREFLTTKFPPGTFPVKIAIPVVPTVRVVITFTKYVPLQQPEQFFTPLSSPRLLSALEEKENVANNKEEETRKADSNKSSWLRWNSSTPKPSLTKSKSSRPSQPSDHSDPFLIPSDFTWISASSKNRELKKSKSRKGKQRDRGMSLAFIIWLGLANFHDDDRRHPQSTYGKNSTS